MSSGAVIPGVLFLAAVSALEGCGGADKLGESPRNGFFSGYDFGNEADREEIRKERPDYRPYE
jgi:hypothetical protein